MSSPVYLTTVSAVGLFSALPSPGIAGRKYYCTDTDQEFYDTGTAWLNISGAGGTPFSTNPSTLADPDGGTTYALESVPANPEASFYFVNGVKRIYGTFYSITGSTLTLLISEQVPVEGDTHEIYYS